MEKFLAAVVLMISILILLFLVSALMAFPTMWLWNGTLIAVFPVIKAVTFMQAWGLNILASILFKTTNYSSTKK